MYFVLVIDILVNGINWKYIYLEEVISWEEASNNSLSHISLEYHYYLLLTLGTHNSTSTSSESPGSHVKMKILIKTASGPTNPRIHNFQFLCKTYPVMLTLG